MIVRPLPELGLYELVEDLPYAGRILRAGLRWNGASIPRLAWPLGYTPFHPRLMRGLAGHDDDYRRRKGLRRVADEWFRVTIIEDGVEEDAAAIMHAVVREHGMGIWTDDEDLAELARRRRAQERKEEEAP